MNSLNRVLFLIGISRSDWAHFDSKTRPYIRCEFYVLKAAIPTTNAFPEIFASKQPAGGNYLTKSKHSGSNYLKGVTDSGREGILPLTYDQLATTCSST